MAQLFPDATPATLSSLVGDNQIYYPSAALLKVAVYVDHEGHFHEINPNTNGHIRQSLYNPPVEENTPEIPKNSLLLITGQRDAFFYTRYDELSHVVVKENVVLNFDHFVNPTEATKRDACQDGQFTQEEALSFLWDHYLAAQDWFVKNLSAVCRDGDTDDEADKEEKLDTATFTNPNYKLIPIAEPLNPYAGSHSEGEDDFDTSTRMQCLVAVVLSITPPSLVEPDYEASDFDSEQEEDGGIIRLAVLKTPAGGEVPAELTADCFKDTMMGINYSPYTYDGTTFFPTQGSAVLLVCSGDWSYVAYYPLVNELLPGGVVDSRKKLDEVAADKKVLLQQLFAHHYQQIAQPLGPHDTLDVAAYAKIVWGACAEKKE